MLNEVCANIKNYFTYEKDKHIGDFAIVDGNITPSFDIQTDYIRIVGSRLNDGVHIREDGVFSLEDEDEFHGGIWVMSVPNDFISLVAEISDWQKKYGNVDHHAMSPFNSESFGGYSYSKAVGSGAGSGSGSKSNWQSQFASRLNMYRRIRI